MKDKNINPLRVKRMASVFGNAWQDAQMELTRQREAP